VRKLQLELLKNKCYLMPFVDVPVTDPAWEMVQRIGLTGILQGTGKPEGWANKTFFYPDSLLTLKELNAGIKKAGILNAHSACREPGHMSATQISCLATKCRISIR
jgi:hypothetical protein